MMRVFSVRDVKAGAYLNPFFCVNRAVAIRDFYSAARDESHAFFRYASDFILYEIGQFDSMSGKLVPIEPDVVAYASEAVTVMEPSRDA